MENREVGDTRELTKGWTKVLRIEFCQHRVSAGVGAQEMLVGLVTREATRGMQYCNRTPGGER